MIQKIFLSSLFAIFFMTFSFSQDVIVKQNGDEIKCKVKEINDTSVSYKDFDFLDGPLRSIITSEVFMIIYENGKREKIEVASNNKKIKSNIRPNTWYGAAGFGISYGTIGVKAQYNLKNENWAVHGGIGYTPFSSADSYSDVDGILASVGIKRYLVNSLYLDLQFGLIATWNQSWGSIESSDYYYEEGYLLGPSLLIGYDWFWNEKVGLNIGAGLSLDFVNGGLWFANDLGIFFKF